MSRVMMLFRAINYRTSSCLIIRYCVTLPLAEIIANDERWLSLRANSGSINRKEPLTRSLQHVSRFAHRPILSSAIIAGVREK